MKQVKNCVPRAAALFLACFVVAFSISIPAAAATVATDFNAIVDLLQFRINYTDGTRSFETDESNVSMPFSDPIDDFWTIAPDVNDSKYVDNFQITTQIIDFPTGKTLRLHLKFVTYAYS